MKKNVFILFLVCIVLLFLSCNKTKEKTLERIISTESGDYGNEAVSSKRIKELEQGIKDYSKDVERVVKANAEIGIYYRMLALEYIDLNMYKLSLDNLQKSMEYYPANPVLSYYAGLSVANISRAEIKEEDRLSMLQKAEKYYLAAIKLRSNYTDAMYALSILYMFDLNSPEEARPLLEKMLSRNPKDWEAMSLYARYRVVSGDIDGAIELYDKISGGAWDDAMKKQAGVNRDLLLAGRS